MTSNEVVELGEQFRSAGKKIEKAQEILAERGNHEAIPRITEQANKAAKAIQAALDLVVEVGASLAGPGPLFEAGGGVESVTLTNTTPGGDGKSVTLTRESAKKASKALAKG